jgi:hypothetical protein
VEQLSTFIIVGFIAQLIDGTLGMGYGVSATSFLLALGVSPPVASASVHAAKVFATGVSGFSHHGFGNTDSYLVRRLVIPGVLGAVLGALILTSVPADTIKPFVAVYLLVMGVVILLKVLKRKKPRRVTTHLSPVGFFGGLFDAIGGGGWGPIVVSTLLGRGSHFRFTVGSASVAEFFVALASTMTFTLTIGLSYWHAIAGLAIGGAMAAPVAAFMCGKVPARGFMAVVGVLIVVLSVRSLYQVFG